ncbi:unnamed protein product [Rotaria magnacalcarata]|uniref:Uncharacterized protein n=1 Tax=Rotaria magnacalcarata TaxID=392030 RepID=A0A816T0K9_9BILA|nr:unnamed protein product [Rotaria magnacalcarata]
MLHCLIHPTNILVTLKNHKILLILILTLHFLDLLMRRGLNFSPITPPSPNINSDEGGSPGATEKDGSDDAEPDASIRTEQLQFLGRGGPPEVWGTPLPAPTKCAPETGARSKGVGSRGGEQSKLTRNLHTPKVAVPPGEFLTSTPGVDKPHLLPLMHDLSNKFLSPPDPMKEFDPNEEDAFISSEEEESFPGFIRFGPSAEMVLDRLESRDVPNSDFTEYRIPNIRLILFGRILNSYFFVCRIFGFIYRIFGFILPNFAKQRHGGNAKQ